MVSSDEVQRAIAEDVNVGFISDIAIDTSPFADEVATGYWDASEAYLRDQAQAVRQKADELGNVQLHYVGIANIPHILALGAYVGDERFVHVHDYDRDANSWAWPQARRTVTPEVIGLPQDRIDLPGAVVIRVEITETISDAEIAAVVGFDKLADVTIRPRGTTPTRGIIRSAADVAAVRQAFRDVMACLGRVREIELIHLFIAAPSSVCFVVGQELHLRSGSAVQTYQHRTSNDGPSYRDAIRLTSAELAGAATPLTDAERELAAEIRASIFAQTLRELLAYAGTKQADATESSGPWYWYLQPRTALRSHGLFPSLPPIWKAVDQRDTVALEPYHDPVAYAHDKDSHQWRLGDRLLLAFHRAVEGDEQELRQLIRLFLFHEYLHDQQALGKYTATDVGSFANCLERIDYLADTYAIMHQLDYTTRHDRGAVNSDDAQRSFIAEQIDLAIRSFWAFEPPPPNTRWQERRLRRYLNWYWRRVQVARADSLGQALAVLSRQPSIELAGLNYSAGRGRVFVYLDRTRAGQHLGIGLVSEDERFLRYGTAGDLSLERLVQAFGLGEHDQIRRFFNSLFEIVNGTGGAFPSAEERSVPTA
jgi:hypothetical protein